MNSREMPPTGHVPKVCSVEAATLTNLKILIIMKVFKNWRYYALVSLSSIGFLAIARAFGDPVRPMSDAEWLLQTAISCSVGFACFYSVCNLAKRWVAKGKLII